MGNLELGIALLIFVSSFILIYRDFKFSLYVLLALSTLLHKELFSFYVWDLLPIRIFMFALFLVALVRVFQNFYEDKNFKRFLGDVITKLREPFIFGVALLWVVRGLSIIFTKNIQASLLLFSFFTAVSALVIWLYIEFKNNLNEVLKYLKFYVVLAFILTLFGYLQIFLYYNFDYLVGAIWNVPEKLPRIGSLFWDVNYYASFLGSLLPVLGVLVVTLKDKKEKIKYGLIFLSLTVGYFLTNSRSGWMIGLIALFVMLTMWGLVGILTGTFEIKNTIPQFPE